MLAKVYRWKNAGLALGIFVLCSIAMTVALAGVGMLDAPVQSNIEGPANESTFPDPPMAPMADPPASIPHETVVIGSQSSAEGDPAPGMPSCARDAGQFVLHNEGRHHDALGPGESQGGDVDVGGSMGIR